MMRRTAVLVACAVLAGVCSSSSDHAAPKSSTTSPPARRSGDTGASPTASGGAEWAVYSHDLSNSRVNVNEHAITRTTVATHPPSRR